MREKIKYEIDPYNRLVAIDESLSLPKQRRVIEGLFAMGRDNSLEYRIKSPAGSSENIPYQVKLRGSWSLTANHDLRFSIDKSAGGASGDALTIAGDIIDAKRDALLFSVTTKRGEGMSTTYVLEVAGHWQSDRNNRLSFRVKRAKDRYDTLLFEAGWELDQNNEIIYRYEKSQLRRRLKVLRCLTLHGQWNIGGNGVLAYEMDAKSNSTLRFKASLGICGQDYIKYEVGIVLASRLRPVKRTITLFGAWRLKRGSALFFDVECSDGTIYSISFSAEARLTPRDTISFKLKDEFGRNDLGMRFELNHALLEGDGNAFLRVMRLRGESAVFIGAGLRW